MKQYLILIALLLIFNFSYSQFGMSYEQVHISLKDSSTVDGYARLGNYDLEFKDSNKKNKKYILFSEINSVKFTVYSGKKKSIKDEFTLVSIQLDADNTKKRNFALAQLIFDKDKIKIYGVYALSGGVGGMGPGLGGQISATNISLGFNGSNYSTYYCYLNQDMFPRLMYEYTSLKTFRIMASDCFKDCKELSDKINNKIFTKDNIIDIGNFYNDKCN